jgi:dTDP-4-amino-4,6-dideoxygalactose transaminase
MSAQVNTPVPLLDLKAQYATIRDAVRTAIDEVCDAQWFVMGPNVEALEKRIAEYSQCRFGIGVSSGTDALLVALMSIDVGHGDAVITTPYTFFATGGTIARLGARPVFCDIDPVTYNIDPESVREVLANQCAEKDGKLIHVSSGATIRAIMPVHLYGQTADIDALTDIADLYGISVVEDAAQSIGSEFVDGSRAGSRGAIGCFSFFPSKNLGAFGDAGMCTTNDEEIAGRMKILRLHGGSPKYHHAVIGGNFRLDALQAAVLLVKLESLDTWTAKRQENAAWYNEAFATNGLSGIVRTPEEASGKRHIYNQYVIRVNDREGLRAYLNDKGIGNEIYYPVPLHLQKCFAYLGHAEGDFPQSESAARETIAIPIYPELTKEQQQHVVSTIAGFYG